MKRIVSIALGVFALAGSLFAEHPNEARGFSADRVYSVNDVDSVNAFNGNLIVRIPIGPEYKVNGQLSYRLSLTYNSHLWHFLDTTSADDVNTVYTANSPRTDNAGLGWRLSLGKLYQPNDLDIVDNGTWVYHGSDGSEHHFYETLHSNGSTATHWPLYTRDSSYIRLTSVDSLTKKVEFPDGTVQTFSQLRRDTWQADAASTKWFLTNIADLLGNSVTIGYSASGQYPEIWTISDGARTTSVFFKGGLTTDFISTLDRVDMQSSGGATLSYSFVTQTVDVQTPSGDTTGRPTITVPVLTAITPTAGKGYSMMVDGKPAYDVTTHISSGVLTRLTPPTLGGVGWSYNMIRFSQIDDNHRSPGVEHPSGVMERTTYDAGGHALATWKYDRKVSDPDFCRAFVCTRPPGPCNSGRPRQMTVFITDPLTIDGVQKTTINYFSNFEFLQDPEGETCSADGWVSAEHGLPFTRYTAKNNRFLSSEVRTGSVFPSLGMWNGKGQVPDTVGTRVRETYLAYDLDPDAVDDEFQFDKNSRLSSTATYFLDDPTGDSTEPHYYTAASYLGFDGFGHYRQSSTGGNFPGTGNYRTTFTNYSAAPVPSSPWLLTPFTEQCTVDETSLRSGDMAASNSSCSALPGALMSRMQFNANGLLTARRTQLQSSDQPHDLLATFAYDAHGNVTTENYYGGDMQVLTTGFTPPTTTPPVYAINHTLAYTGGALTGDKATYSNGATKFDEKYDQATGAVTDVRDVSGLNTHYIYDPLGRVTHVQPPGVAETMYTYSDASFANPAFTPAKVLAESSSAGLGSIRKEYQYDAFGRLWRQKSLLADGVSWNIVQNDYDLLGRKSAVSMPQTLAGLESSFAPAHQTRFDAYDTFGRAASVIAPDGFTTHFLFTGTRRVDRTVTVATTSTGCTPADTTGCSSAITTEIHDASGRLIQVTEQSGTTSLAKTTGDNTDTKYKYDSGDHLIEVSTPPQTRTFTYDHRGFLTSEQHPEVGVNGGQPITYVYTSPQGAVGYDARGHAHGRLTGPVNGLLDLRYDYDDSERLTNIYDSGDSKRPLKDYSYWTDTTAIPPNLGSGKLRQAVRHNHPLGFPGEVTVKETYTYATLSGRVSKRDTLIESVNGGSPVTLQSFTQDATYDQLGSIARIDYPACGVACTSPPQTGPAYTRANGFLTGVTGYASPITYNPDGSIFEITHDATHGVKDTYTPDSSGMGRPGMISFSGATACTAAATVSGGGSIISGQTAQIIADLLGTAPWSITWSDGVTETATQAHWTRNVTPSVTTTYTITNVTDATSCSGSRGGSAIVNVQSCGASAVVTGSATITSGQATPIFADFTGTAPWNITWSDGLQQTATQSHWTRNVSPTVTTTYTLTSATDATSCAAGRTGSAVITVQSCSASATVSGSATISAGQTAQIVADLTGTAPWSITWSDGITESATQAHWLRTVSPTVTTTYTLTNATDATSCAANRSGTATVTVQSCNAQISVGSDAGITQGQTATLTATLSGGNPPSSAAPWSITWSDGVTENVNHTPWTRSVRPLSSTVYRVTSFTAGTGCSGAGTGSAIITVAPLPAPGTLSALAITDPSTHTTLTVSVQWSAVPFADWYQVERATRLVPGDWQPVSGHVTSPWPNPLAATADPVTYLYRVRAGVTSGGVDATSVPSPIDYATVATTLFTDEPLAAGVTLIKGIHIGELRHAIDAVRRATGTLGSAWSSYGAATGPVTASDNITARQRLDEATVILVGHGVFYTGEVPAANGRIWALQLQQIRDGVR
jgi:YD repeat-containing protein